MTPGKHQNSQGFIIIRVPVGGLKIDPNVAKPMGIVSHSSLESVNEISPAQNDPRRPQEVVVLYCVVLYCLNVALHCVAFGGGCRIVLYCVVLYCIV